MSEREAGPPPRAESERRLARAGQRSVPIRYLVPNLFTLLSLAAGITAIRAAIEGRFELGVGLIVLAALLDGVDGRLARLLDAQSRFGAELDSLADCVSFGVAPAILVYLWALVPLQGAGWVAALVLAAAASLRLARFNAALDEERPKWQGDFFTGVPAPAGAILVMLPLYLESAGLAGVRAWPAAIALYVLLVAGLLVSTLPTFSGKLMGERIAREYVGAALGAAALVIALLATYPFATLAAASLAYLVLLPLGLSRYRTLSAAEAAATTQATSEARH